MEFDINKKPQPLSLKNETKTVAQHAVIYGIGNLLNRVIGFLMIPVYTRFFNPADYGIMEIVAISTQIIGIVAAVGITHAISRFYFNYDDPIDQNEVLSTSIISFSVLSLVVISTINSFFVWFFRNSFRVK